LASGAFPTQDIPEGSRIACRVEYDGGGYCGWQSQPGEDVPTVQDTLESALGDVADRPVRVHCAGRTDTGVHAHAQVVHFDSPATRSPKAWVVGGNANLPPDVRLHWAVAVPHDFHARHSALSRRYRYLVANTPVRPGLQRDRLTWHRRVLDEAAMDRAARELWGERDFSAFRAASCQSASPMRNVHFARVARRGDLVVLDIEANAFLHHMVRNIAGALLAVGDGREGEDSIAQLLAGRDRTLAADTAPAHGLYLVDVAYTAACGLPETPPGPDFLDIGP